MYTHNNPSPRSGRQVAASIVIYSALKARADLRPMAKRGKWKIRNLFLLGIEGLTKGSGAISTNNMIFVSMRNLKVCMHIFRNYRSLKLEILYYFLKIVVKFFVIISLQIKKLQGNLVRI